MKKGTQSAGRVTAKYAADKWTGRSQMTRDTDGSEYAADEIEFLRAVDGYKRKKGRPFPTLVELLNVVKGLGYRKG